MALSKAAELAQENSIASTMHSNTYIYISNFFTFLIYSLCPSRFQSSRCLRVYAMYTGKAICGYSIFFHYQNQFLSFSNIYSVQYCRVCTQSPFCRDTITHIQQYGNGIFHHTPDKYGQIHIYKLEFMKTQKWISFLISH